MICGKPAAAKKSLHIAFSTIFSIERTFGARRKRFGGKGKLLDYRESMKSMFEEAKEGRYAIMAFNYSDMWDLWAIERAARETRSPVIFSCYTAMYQELGVDWFAGLGEALMKRGERFYHHQDHSHDPELCRQAARLLPPEKRAVSKHVNTPPHLDTFLTCARSILTRRMQPRPAASMPATPPEARRLTPTTSRCRTISFA